MANFKDLTTEQLQRVLTIRQQIDDLESQLASIGVESGKRGPGRPKGKNKMSAAGRAAISAAAKKRWANYQPKDSAKVATGNKGRKKMSAASRARMAAAAKARWAKAKKAGKNSL